MAVDGGYNAPWGKNDIISIPGNSQETATTTLLSLSVCLGLPWAVFQEDNAKTNHFLD